MTVRKETMDTTEALEEAVNAGFLEPRTIAIIAGFDADDVDDAVGIEVEFEDDLVIVTVTPPTLDYEALVRSRIDQMNPTPDEVYDTNHLRVARWGTVVAWTDGPRSDVSRYDTEAQAREAFLLGIRENFQ